MIFKNAIDFQNRRREASTAPVAFRLSGGLTPTIFPIQDGSVFAFVPGRKPPLRPQSRSLLRAESAQEVLPRFVPFGFHGHKLWHGSNARCRADLDAPFRRLRRGGSQTRQAGVRSPDRQLVLGLRRFDPAKLARLI